MKTTQKTLLTCCLLGLLGAVGAYYLGKEQDRIRSLYGKEPQTLSVADLAAKSYGNNIWVDLSEAELGPTYVVQTRKGTMNAVWVPVFPKGKAKDAKTIQVLLRSSHSRTDADIAERFAGRSTFRGAVINPILLTPYEPYRSLLQQKYPTMELAPTIWEVDVDYSKPSTRWAEGCYAVSVGLGVVGMICGIAFLVGLGSPAVSPLPEPSSRYPG